jgi:hypothetical protein
MLGTFHSKFSVIDRKIGLLQSSNIQDNDNLEMLIRVEGPIVDSLYDSLLISWDKPLHPPLPLINTPAASMPLPTYSAESANTTALSEASDSLEPLPESTIQDPHYDLDIVAEARRVNGLLKGKEGESRREAVTRHLSRYSRGGGVLPVLTVLYLIIDTTKQPDTTGDAPEEDQARPMQPYLVIPPHEPVPMAMVNREPWGSKYLSTLSPISLFAKLISSTKSFKHPYASERRMAGSHQSC